MTSPSIVRQATPEDYDEIWSLLRLLHKENGIFDQSEAKVEILLKRLLWPELIPYTDTGVRGYIGVIGSPNALEGFIIIVVGTYWYTDQMHLEELATFVHPNHRRSNHAQALLNYSKKLSDGINMPILIGIISNKRTESKVRLYRKYFKEVGSFFFYGLNGD